MPILDSDNMDRHVDGTGYGFSAKRIELLGASEYTLVGVATDVSGSVCDFLAEIAACVSQIVRACRRSPRADNLLLRIASFDNHVQEIHGFRPLSECNPDDYLGTFEIGGNTALFDAACNVVESVARYGKDLVAQDFAVNGIVFVITDGDDNASRMTVQSLKTALRDAVRGESLESLVSVLVGVNTDAQSGLNRYLEAIARDAGFTQYVAIGKADDKVLAKLAEFVSRSISSQSQALGTGGPSQVFTF
jgi:uncharacterized protein YegL